ncbi:MAG TPA: carbon-nitrogen hydrolase family protein [Alphaproteobacteria bacterium]|nr:carbon-nitrogen hydrolase family protein [Alphaproteobacteria bacterium]
MILRVACLQLNARPDLDANLDEVERLARAAGIEGAELIATPENTSGMYANRSALIDSALPEAGHPGLKRLTDLARETGVWLVVGSLSIRLENDKLANRCFLIDPAGTVAARYDKIHMFDSDPPDGQPYRESATFEPGKRAVVAETPFGRLGLSICYDVRFPALYAELARAGAKMISVPAAFTVPTGQAHWHVLLRARAIETGTFVIAPAQTGEHAGGRRTYGHSLIVSPWGEVLADGGDSTGIAAAELDFERVAAARRMIRSLDHVRPFAPASAEG